MLNRLFRSKPEKSAGQALYAVILQASRRPEFFAEAGVPDTLEGRMEMVMLHAAMVISTLHTSEDPCSRRVSQALFDAMFDDFDSSMRELGVGDSGVGKKIRFMAEGFYGRASAYETAIKSNDSTELTTALARNLYADENRSEDAEKLASYVRRLQQSLHDHGPDSLAKGEAVEFPSL